MNKILGQAERRALKARAHPLQPVVMIGNEGLSASVLKEIDVSLNAHELIKIKVASDDADEREDMMGLICANTGASAIQHIGKVLVVYRERPTRGQGAARNGNTKAAQPGQQPRGERGERSERGARPGSAPRKPGSGPVWTKARPPKRRKPGAQGQGAGQGGQGGQTSQGQPGNRQRQAQGEGQGQGQAAGQGPRGPGNRSGRGGPRRGGGGGGGGGNRGPRRGGGRGGQGGGQGGGQQGGGQSGGESGESGGE